MQRLGIIKIENTKFTYKSQSRIFCPLPEIYSRWEIKKKTK